jgi:hypothetical protein
MIRQDEELDALEENIRKLKNKYDQFFAAISKVPPMADRRNVEIMIYEIGKQKMRDNGRRFRYQTILTRYNQFRELWGRKMREREEGPMDFRRRQAALQAEPPTPEIPTPSVTSPRPEPSARKTVPTSSEEIHRLYEDIEREHLKMGKLPPVSIEQFGVMVAKQSEAVRAKYNVSGVVFRVETVDGKVKLKAKPLQE